MTLIMMMFFKEFWLLVSGVHMDVIPDVLLQLLDPLPVLRCDEGEGGKVSKERPFSDYIFVFVGHVAFQ
jgi:hypothetical protein